mgnify:CR=1 FL=1
MDQQLGIFLAAVMVPEWLNLIEARLFKPNMLPLLKFELIVGEVVLHSIDKIGENGILPLEFVEILA